MPPKNVAGLLNNESNLRILEKLKVKAYYPRELAAEMKLSESFIVRRLKAMEEFDIVEGRWESEGGRKVKRYYLKDVTMQLGKDGLKVTTGAAPAKGGDGLKNGIVRFLIYLPALLVIFVGGFFHVAPIEAATFALFVWLIAIDATMYRQFHYKTFLAGGMLLAIAVVSGLIQLTLPYFHYDPSTQPSTLYGLIYAFIGLACLIDIVYFISFYQSEIRDMNLDKRGFVAGLHSKPLSAKLFYLPLVLRWQLNVYFGLV